MDNTASGYYNGLRKKLTLKILNTILEPLYNNFTMINEKTLSQVEKLAKLTLNEEQRSLAISKMQGILDMLDKIDMQEIEDLAPLYHPLEIAQPFRDDEASSQIDRELLQKNAPAVENGLFLVPKVID